METLTGLDVYPSFFLHGTESRLVQVCAHSHEDLLRSDPASGTDGLPERLLVSAVGRNERVVQADKYRLYVLGAHVLHYEGHWSLWPLNEPQGDQFPSRLGKDRIEQSAWQGEYIEEQTPGVNIPVKSVQMVKILASEAVLYLRT
jgi:hypothetical protein